jgi:uncharacterized membrane protein
VFAEDVLKVFAEYTSLCVEAIAVLAIAFGALESAVLGAAEVMGWRPRALGWRRALFTRFARWLIFGLEYALAADIVRTVISPTWNDIGQLAAIAAIRTFLNYFLERDLREVR